MNGGSLDITSRYATCPLSHDPWDRWTFQGRLNGNGNGEASTTSLSLSGAFSASRVTDETKFNASVNGSYAENNYVLP